MEKIYIIDFDSTFVSVEVMDELAVLALEGSSDREKIVNQIKEITQAGMEGRIPFDQSLQKRIKLLQANREYIKNLIPYIREKVSFSIKKNKIFFQDNSNSIYIISGGFKEIIVPVVADFGIKAENVFANTFRFDDKEKVISVDENNFLAQEGGKVKQIRSLELAKDIYIIGDGFTDYQIKAAGLANKFIAFTENVTRPNVVSLADYAVSSWDEFLAKENLK